MNHTISKTFSIGYNIGMEWRSFSSQPAYIYTLGPHFNINENWSAFIEIFGFIWKNYKPEHSIDAGIAYYINDNFKVDAYAGLGLTKRNRIKFYSIGTSFRFQNSK